MYDHEDDKDHFWNRTDFLDDNYLVKVWGGIDSEGYTYFRHKVIGDLSDT